MTRPYSRHELVLALHPHTRGLAYALFEGPLSPIDWGIRDIRGRDARAQTVDEASAIIDRTHPDALVIENRSALGRRGERATHLMREVAANASSQLIEVVWYQRADIRAVFEAGGATTRYEIASVIARLLHAFGHQLPPPPVFWKSEDTRMALFDAVSLAMTHYAHLGQIRMPER